MRKPLRFLHTADLHLDSPFKGMANVPKRLFQQMVNSTFQAFDRLIETAITYQVDFVLMVGDLFDEEARSLKAQMKVRQGLEKLHQHNIDVFISFGNHDHLGGTFFHMDYPENVHFFQSEQVTSIPFYQEGMHVANIYGFSYENRAVYEEKVNEYVTTNEPIYHIGILHGSLSTNQEHDVYAPFRLTDFRDSHMDYWALGHIHKREELMTSPPVVYPGNIQGRHINEPGEKGVYVIDVKDNYCEKLFVPTQAFRFESLELDLTDCTSIDEVEVRLQHQKETVRSTIGSALIRFSIKINQTSIPHIDKQVTQELQDLLNEMEEFEQDWMWIEKIKVEKMQSWTKEELKRSNHFIGELVRVFEHDRSWIESLTELTDHREFRKLLEPLSDDELSEIKDEAEELLLEELMKE
ncbi:DNA repair exonuclease SbcCD nuclease subunit [Salinibacillus kushneri]|uniref:DNA repair exonuclease SbcCD nuclease subunit n=1 Tax=Salinibacillus kushneri TaxID=237682 RepID=A0A1I0AVW0_9BACI|nr:DNA repair exonuclease [Salinibacillus kushneri]SES98513.1 DNA repair exonuclease SbcCD nuclease subunit [Salinibacillus kushneri]